MKVDVNIYWQNIGILLEVDDVGVPGAAGGCSKCVVLHSLKCAAS